MKFTLLSLICLVSAPFAFSQAKSDVVGYVSLGNTSGGDAVPVGAEITVSIPFVKKADASLSIDSVSGNIITINESITSGMFNTPASGSPYMVEVSSGTDEGIFLEIDSNTVNTITLSGFGTGSLSGIANDDSIVVRKAWTISTVFGSSLPDNTFISTFDNAGINASAVTQYITFGGQWFNSTTGSLSDDVILYPGESFLYRNNSSTPVANFTIEGIVPTTKSRISLKKDSSAAQETRFSYFSPTSETLGDSGLSSIVNDNDYISFFNNNATGLNKSASAQYIFFGGDWYSSTTGDVSNSVKLEGGQGYLLRRIDTNTTDAVVVDEQSYIPNL